MSRAVSTAMHSGTNWLTGQMCVAFRISRRWNVLSSKRHTRTHTHILACKYLENRTTTRDNMKIVPVHCRISHTNNITNCAPTTSCGFQGKNSIFTQQKSFRFAASVTVSCRTSERPNHKQQNAKETAQKNRMDAAFWTVRHTARDREFLLRIDCTDHRAGCWISLVLDVSHIYCFLLLLLFMSAHHCESERACIVSANNRHTCWAAVSDGSDNMGKQWKNKNVQRKCERITWFSFHCAVHVAHFHVRRLHEKMKIKKVFCIAQAPANSFDTYRA